jgi:acyl transferase domain-containing protein/thioesterase domain-containing protein
VAFAASANLYLHPRTYIDLCLGKLVTREPEPHCFSAAGDGFVPGEAVGAVLLKPLAEAVRDGDPIHGVIRATAINHGGKTTGYTAPSLPKQAEVIRLALARAGGDANSIDFVEAAANGSSLGDDIELQALKQVFKSRAAGCCNLGTLKASVGHSEAASGVSQLTKVLLQMKHQMLAPTRVLAGSVNGAFHSAGSPFNLVTEATPWPRRTSPRRALITSFGAGGSYGAMIVEDHAPPADVPRFGGDPVASSCKEHLLVLSARTEQQLRVYASRLSAHLKAAQDSLASVACTLQQGRDAMEYGLAIVAPDRAAAVGQLEAFVDGRECPDAVEAGTALRFSGRRTKLGPEGVRESGRQAVGKRDLKALAQLWLSGCHDAPWSELYDKSVPRCSLPTYPFEERTFWYDQRPPTAPIDGRSPPGHPGQQSAQKLEKDLSSTIRDILLLSDEDVLDVEANFSELGLDSVSGVHFVRKLAQTRGVELRDTIIFDHPSVAALARHLASLEAASVNESAPQAPIEQPVVSAEFKRRLGRLMREHAEIVPLQVEGDGPLLFCLHPMSGDVGLYAKLAQASNLRFRMIGIKSRGFLSDAEPLDTIPAMAEHAVSLAAAILPEGPFHLFGASMGGTVAYECARQFQLRGLPVRTLLLLEPPLVENEADARLWASGSLQNWIMNANFLMIGVLHMDPDFRRRKAAGAVRWSQLEITRSEIEGAQEPDVVARLVALIKTRGAAMPEESLSDRLRSMAAVHMANLRGLSRYRAEPLVFQDGIKAVLVRTQSGAAVSADVYNPDYLVAVQQAKGSLLPFFEGWKRVLPGIVVEVVEGENHFALLSATSAVRHVVDVVARSLNVSTEQETADTPTRSLPPTRMGLQSPKVAVVGMSGRFPGAPNAEALWDLLKRGDSAFTELPADRGWSLPVSSDGRLTTPIYVSRGGFLPDVDRFDPAFFGIPPSEAESIDAAERLFLEETWKAIEDAGVDPTGLAGKRWGVFCGGGGDVTLRLKELSGVSPHVTASSIPGRVSYSLNLTGPCVAVDAGCASSMLAIAQAADALLLGQCDVAIAGGVWVFSTPNLLHAGCQSRLFSEEDRGRALSAQAGGMMAGEAVGALILKPLEKAAADGDRIYGVIEGWGSGHNGRTNGMAAPSVSGQAALYSDVYRRFGIDPATVGLMEANAVGTPLGDTMEVEALTSAFRAATARHSYCALSTVENNIGHAFQASGIAHVIKVLLALGHKEIPATVNAGSPNARMNLERTPFFINSGAMPWQVQNGDARRAATSSFGTTGINVHLVLCEAPPPPTPAAWEPAGAGRFHLIALSARTRTAVVTRCRELQDYMTRQEDAGSELIGRISANLMLRRSHFAERCAFVAADAEDLERQLSTVARGEVAENVLAGSVNRATNGLDSSAAADALTQLAAIQRRTDRGTLLALAELHVHGVPLDLAQCFSDAEKTPLSLPSYPFERRRCWPAADRPASDAHQTPEAPAASTKKTTALCEIQSIVGEVSGYELSELATDVPLSRLGLDSLMSMRVLALVNERFSLAIHLADLAENGSIQDLASLAEAEAEADHRPVESQAHVVKPGSVGVSSRAAWLFRRFAPVPRGLSVKSVQAEAANASLKLTDPVAKLLRAGIAVCHDGVECHFVAHRSADAIAVYESLSSEDRSEFLAGLPAGVLVAPISQEQERNLYHSEVMKRPSWNLQQTFELRAPLDEKLLDAAMRRLIGNHDVLRTHYLRLGDSWAQVVVPEVPIAIQNAGVTSLQALQRLLETERNKLLDVYRLPVFRVWIAEAGGAHHLAFVTHHSLADAFTPGMLLSELMTCYDALREGRAIPTREIDEQYWQYALRQFDPTVYRGQRTLQYWRERLSGRATAMRLPYSRSPHEIGPDLLEVSDLEPASVSPGLTGQIERFGREHDVTHTQLFTAAIAMALVHGLGNASALLRFVNSQRGSASLMNTAGEFTSVAFLALDVDRSATLLDALREVKRRSLECLKFSRVDFREVLRSSDLLDYEGYYRQIGDVMLDSIDLDTGGAPTSESHSRLLYGEARADSGAAVELPAAGTLMFQLLKLDGRIQLLTFYRKHLFEKTVIRDLCDLIVGFVEGMVTRPTQRVSELLSSADATVRRLRSHVDRHQVDPARDASGRDAEAGPEVLRSAYFTECQRVNAVKQGRPVFWVHGAFGDASVYIPLARRIERPFYGIQARGLFDERTPLSGVEAIASFYAGMIQAIQPRGPYDLGGYSVGGVFAYEVARQLVAAGHEVQSLCLVDTLFHPYYETLLRCSGGLRETYEFVSLGLLEMAGLQPGAFRRLRESVGEPESGDADILLSVFVDACREAGVAKPRIWIESFIRRMVELLRGYRIGDYSPRALSGGIEAVRYFRRRGGWVLGAGSERENGRAAAPVDYWSEWSTLLPNIEYREVVADHHMSILREAEALGAIAESCGQVYRAGPSTDSPASDSGKREPGPPLSNRESPAVKDTVGRIVSQVLYRDVSEVDPKQDLSSYGMDSFATAQLLQRLRVAFELDLDMETMFTLRTVSDIAQYVEQRKGHPGAPGPRRSASEAHRAEGAAARRFPELIRLNRVIEGRPVFWFHGGLGGVEVYRQIADVSERPFFGIQARGWMTDRAPLHGIQAMTAYYVHIMQSVRPTGPYDVGGYSLGGLIAYEAVRQLQELDESVSTLVMVDTLDSSAFRDASMSNRADELARPILNFALQSWAAATGADPSTLLIHRDEVDTGLDAELKLTRLIALAQARGLRQPEAQLRAMIGRLSEVHQAYEAERYRVRPLAHPEGVDCRYFRNKGGLFFGELEPFYVAHGDVRWDHAVYWAEWLEQLPNLHMTDVEASNHMMLLTEPKARDVIVSSCRRLYSQVEADGAKA